MKPSLHLINWLWLEDLLVRACELDLQNFGAAHADQAFFGYCLEHDGVAGTLRACYGAYAAADGAAAHLARDSGGLPVYYRNVQLRPAHWRYRVDPEPDGPWRQARGLMGAHAENMAAAEEEPEVIEFLWLRFEYLAECVVRRLSERGAFRYLTREPEFIAFSGHEHETLEELEDRLERSHPRYRRATVEWATRPRLGGEPSRRCAGHQEPRPPAVRRRLRLARCTSCHEWFCADCLPEHLHPELFYRTPLFHSELPPLPPLD